MDTSSGIKNTRFIGGGRKELPKQEVLQVEILRKDLELEQDEDEDKDLQVEPCNNIHSTQSCPICFDMMENPISISCGHVFCVDCICTWCSTQEKMDFRWTCPLCRHLMQ